MTKSLEHLVAALRSEVSGSVLTGESVHAYRHDQCLMVSAGVPAAVVEAATVDDVRTTLRLANSGHVPVVVRGAGTGLAGAANAVDGCVVLSLASMDRIIDIDTAARTARVQPGVINGVLVDEAERHGLTYAPDPGSRLISTIGGNIATNAGGMCCVKYGVTRDHVLSLDVVLPGGDLIHTGSPSIKNVAGLDLTSLIVGSEGTLGVVVEALVRLQPMAADVATIAAYFPTVAQAVEAVVDVCRVATPCTVELMDQVTLAAVEAYRPMGLETDAGCLVLIQFDGGSGHDEVLSAVRVCRSRAASETFVTHDRQEGQAFMAARREALPALESAGTVLLDDVAVPVPRLSELNVGIAAIARAWDLQIAVFGHAADGNLHPTIIFDPADTDSRRAAEAAFAEIVDLSLSLDGTVTGEHGVGRLKLPFLARQVGRSETELMQRIRECFDPVGILGAPLASSSAG